MQELSPTLQRFRSEEDAVRGEGLSRATRTNVCEDIYIDYTQPFGSIIDILVVTSLQTYMLMFERNREPPQVPCHLLRASMGSILSSLNLALPSETEQ